MCQRQEVATSSQARGTKCSASTCRFEPRCSHGGEWDKQAQAGPWTEDEPGILQAWSTGQWVVWAGDSSHLAGCDIPVRRWLGRSGLEMVGAFWFGDGGGIPVWRWLGHSGSEVVGAFRFGGGWGIPV